jgi:hypothetical protein
MREILITAMARYLSFKVLGLIIFLGLIVVDVQAQMKPFILLEKPGTSRRIRYYVGDEISYKFKEGDFYSKGIITAIGDSTFATSKDFEVRYDTLQSISTTSPFLGVRKATSFAIYAVPPILVYSAADNLFNRDNGFTVSEEAWWVAGAFVGIAGLGLLIPKEKQFRLLKTRWRVIPIIH